MSYGVVVCGFRVSTDRLDRIHPLDGECLQKKRKKERKRRESSRSVVGWVLYDGQRVFQNAKCEHMFIERVKGIANCTSRFNLIQLIDPPLLSSDRISSCYCCCFC